MNFALRFESEGGQVLLLSREGFWIIQADLEQCRVKRQGRNGAFVLTTVWLYQVCFITDYREGKPLAHVKDHLDCARWRIPTG